MKRSVLATLFLTAALPTLALATPEPEVPGKKDDAPSHYHQGEHHGPKGPMFGEGRHHHDPLEKLDLTKEQKRDLHKIKAKEMEEQREITRRYLDKLPEAERQALRKDMHENREQSRKAVHDLLTPEQQKKFDEHEKRMQEKHKEFEEFKQWKAERDGQKQQ